MIYLYHLEISHSGFHHLEDKSTFGITQYFGCYLPYFSMYPELNDITYFFSDKGGWSELSITNQMITTNLFKKENGP